MATRKAHVRERFPVLATIAACVLGVLVAGCTAAAGRRYTETSEDGRERVAGVSLGGVGTVANLSQGYPWVSETALARRWVEGRDAGNVFFAKVTTPLETFGFRQLALKGPAGERTIPGRIRDAFHVPGFYDPRYTEVIEVPLRDEDVRWMVDAGNDLDLRMEGDGRWIKLPPGSELARAVQEYARTCLGARPLVEGALPETSRGSTP